MAKYIFITGGVVSGLGKGIAAASIGLILKSRGYKVVNQKFDPYLNIDPGTMNPYQHGEVFVTDDGAETDLDLGHYERFTDASLSQSSNTTAGRVYLAVLNKEREGGFHGGTVQVIPNITEEILRRMMLSTAETNADVIITEIGGTVGDIESLPFMEAIRQMKYKVGEENCCYIHLTLVPYMKKSHELKTKPTQHSVKQLQEAGIQPDILLCRTANELDMPLRKKIALFCNVAPDAVFSSVDVQKSVYELPVIFHKEGFDARVLKKLALTAERCNIRPWTAFLEKLNACGPAVCIAVVGKKDYLDDCYKSVRESLFHAAVTQYGAELKLRKIDAETLESCKNEKEIAAAFKDVDGIVVPANYGQRGFLGLLVAVKYARENDIPYLGIDLGMQLMAIETGRSLCGWADADSTEFIQNSTHAIISLPEEQTGLSAAGTMKLGAGTVRIIKDTKLAGIYKKLTITERHRNKYTFDKKYTADMTEHGLITSAVSEPDNCTEAFEWQDHTWGIGVQYHPEFVSRPMKPHPLFVSFIGAALGKKQ